MLDSRKILASLFCVTVKVSHNLYRLGPLCKLCAAVVVAQRRKRMSRRRSKPKNSVLKTTGDCPQRDDRNLAKPLDGATSRSHVSLWEKRQRTSPVGVAFESRLGQSSSVNYHDPSLGRPGFSSTGRSLGLLRLIEGRGPPSLVYANPASPTFQIRVRQDTSAMFAAIDRAARLN